MNPSTRILRDNRRDSARGTDPVDALLAAAIALLALFGLFRRRKEAPKVKARLSERTDAEWAEFLNTQLAVARKAGT